jgi:hypothetical protein
MTVHPEPTWKDRIASLRSLYEYHEGNRGIFVRCKQCGSEFWFDKTRGRNVIHSAIKLLEHSTAHPNLL